MKQPLLLALGLLVYALGFSQKNYLVGTWYVKETGYPEERSKAFIYTKTKPRQIKQVLTVDKMMNYTYREFNQKDTVTNTGALKISGDTLIFNMSTTNNVIYRHNPVVKVYLYHNDASRLVYSYYWLTEESHASVIEDGASFQSVQEAARYNAGANEFYKILYQALPKPKPVQAQLLDYSITVKDTGEPDISSLKALNGFSAGFIEYISKGLLALPSGFSPAVQNAKRITASFRFSINY
jgi:hypothetical protein